MSEKKSFVMYKSWEPLITEMPIEKAGELMQAIFAYQCDKDVCIEDPMVSAVCSMIRATMDEDQEKYKAECEKRAENGKRGAKSKWQKPSSAIEDMAKDGKCHDLPSSAIEDMAKMADKDNESDSDNESDKDNESPTETEKRGTPKASPEKRKRFSRPSLAEVKQYIKEKGYHVDAEAFFAYYDSVGWMVGNHHMQSWKSAVVTWEKRDRKPVARSGTTDDFDSNAYLLNIINEGG